MDQATVTILTGFGSGVMTIAVLLLKGWRDDRKLKVANDEAIKKQEAEAKIEAAKVKAREEAEIAKAAAKEAIEAARRKEERDHRAQEVAAREALAELTIKKAEELARITVEQNQASLEAGAKRAANIMTEVKQIKSVAVKSALKSEEAIRVSNGHNEKNQATLEIANKALELNSQVLDKLTDPKGLDVNVTGVVETHVTKDL
jgi:hypothetical protein